MHLCWWRPHSWVPRRTPLSTLGERRKICSYLGAGPEVRHKKHFTLGTLADPIASPATSGAAMSSVDAAHRSACATTLTAQFVWREAWQSPGEGPLVVLDRAAIALH